MTATPQYHDADDLFGEPIYSYTRAQAIDDGVLVDLSEWAQETGFKFDVVCTAGVWGSCISWRPEDGGHQDERGRAHDVLWMLLCAIRAGQGGDRVDFSLIVCGQNGKRTTRKLWALCGPGDTRDAKPVITIMLPGED